MVDPSPVLTSQGTDDSGAYRPVSGLAIAGLGLSILYTGLVVTSAVAALVQGAPFFLAGWMVLLAILGVSLSALAMWQIRKAEGTRAGLKVAQWGLGLSLVSGLGYTAYSFFTSLAVKVQANHFLTVAGEDAGFFPLLEKGELNAAFLLTQPFARRTGSNPRDEEAMRRQFDGPISPSPTGYLTRFHNDNFVRILMQAHQEGGQVEVEPAGVQSWNYTAKGYKIVRRYRITTPEVILDAQMTVQSTESDTPGEGRKWFIVWPESGYVPPLDHTPAGEKMRELRMKSREFVDGWLDDLRSGRSGPAFLKTLEPTERGPASRQAAVQVATLEWAISNTACGPFSFISVCTIWPIGKLAIRLPGSDRFANGSSYLKTDDPRMPDGAPKTKIIADFKHAFLDDPAATIPVLRFDDPRFVFWEITPAGNLRVTHGFQVNLVADEPGREHRFMGRGRLVVETAVPGDPRTTEFAPQWRVVEVDLDRVLPMPRGK